MTYYIMNYMDEITNYLKRIDFEPPDDVKPNLYVYLHNNLFQTDYEYEHPEYKPLKSFKVILKMIQQERHYDASLF
jgi:hypothetical protein